MEVKQIKTNALRMLDRAAISYEVRTYDPEQAIDGVAVAACLHESTASVYKTLVTTGHSKQHYVFCIPVDRQLDLKACAKAVKEKSIEMLPMKELLGLTGYVHGGCSPVGMKKPFPVVIQRDCETQKQLYLSAGRRGMQMRIAVEDLMRITKATLADVCKQEEER